MDSHEKLLQRGQLQPSFGAFWSGTDFEPLQATVFPKVRNWDSPVMVDSSTAASGLHDAVAVLGLTRYTEDDMNMFAALSHIGIWDFAVAKRKLEPPGHEPHHKSNYRCSDSAVIAATAAAIAAAKPPASSSQSGAATEVQRLRETESQTKRAIETHIDTQRHRDAQRHTKTDRYTQTTGTKSGALRHTVTHIPRHTHTHRHTHTYAHIRTHIHIICTWT